jgi:predicted nucleotidyltransferase
VNPVYEEKYLNLLKEIVLEVLKEKECKVYLFGSRARGDYTRISDADIGIEGLSKKEFIMAKWKIEEMVEESIIPFRVDIVNLEDVDDNFKKEIFKDAVVWRG